MERHVRERSVERAQDRAPDRGFDRISEKTRDERGRDDRSKLRYSEVSLGKSHVDDRFHGQNLPPPPPLPPHVVPQSLSAGRREEDSERRYAVARHAQRLSPRHDERERRRSEENTFVSADDMKRRRDEELRDRKRDEREVPPLKAEERERKRTSLKEEIDANVASKRRKLKREYVPEVGEYSPGAAVHPPQNVGMTQAYDQGERKGAIFHRPGYVEEPVPRLHPNDAASKMARRDAELMYDREWEEEKRQRAEQKMWRHRK